MTSQCQNYVQRRLWNMMYLLSNQKLKSMSKAHRHLLNGLLSKLLTGKEIFKKCIILNSENVTGLNEKRDVLNIYFQISMRCMPVAIHIKRACHCAFKIRTSRDAISVSLLQKTLHDAVHVHPSHQNGASGRAREIKIIGNLQKRIDK